MAKIAARRGYGITSVEFFVMGAIAKAVATVLTYPLQIAQSKLRADKGKGPNSIKTYSGKFGTCVGVWVCMVLRQSCYLRAGGSLAAFRNQVRL
jgi:hypothetical protein